MSLMKLIKSPLIYKSTKIDIFLGFLYICLTVLCFNNGFNYLISFSSSFNACFPCWHMGWMVLTGTGKPESQPHHTPEAVWGSTTKCPSQYKPLYTMLLGTSHMPLARVPGICHQHGYFSHVVYTTNLIKSKTRFLLWCP